MKNLYVQGTALHGAVRVKVEKKSPIMGRNPNFNLERVEVIITTKVGEMLVDSIITIFSEDGEGLELEVAE